jgi:hypothetical protein
MYIKHHVVPIDRCKFVLCVSLNHEKLKLEKHISSWNLLANMVSLENSTKDPKNN